MESGLFFLIYRLRTPSSGTKMLVVIIQLSRMKPQGFGLQIQCSLHGTTAASPCSWGEPGANES